MYAASLKCIYIVQSSNYHIIENLSSNLMKTPDLAVEYSILCLSLFYLESHIWNVCVKRLGVGVFL